MSDPGLTSEQRAAIAVHNATQNRVCLNLSSGNGQICVACSEVADQIDAAVEVERQRSQAALAAARRETARLRAFLDARHIISGTGLHYIGDTDSDPLLPKDCPLCLAAPAAGEEK